jgi:Domain of unknown function (DUF1931)
MATKALLVRLEAKSGKEDAVEEFLLSALPLVEQEPGTKPWFAVRFGPSTFGIIDAFPEEAARETHLGGPVGKALAGRDAAKRNGRDVVVPQGRRITKGVQERMREFDNFSAAANVWSPSRLPEWRLRCGRRLICCSIPTPLSWFAWWFAPLGPEQSTRRVQEKPRRHRP